MDTQYQAITSDEENQNVHSIVEEDEPSYQNQVTPRVAIEEPTMESRVAVHRKICCWKCLTSEYFIFGVHSLPVTFAVLILLALVINYSVAVSSGHLVPFLPYVSWLASKSPEEYIFDFIMSLAAINVAFIIYFKFKTIADNYQGPHILTVLIINRICAWLGILASLVFLLASTFPAVPEKRIAKVHRFASIIAFFLICVYFIIETVMSFKIQYRIRRVNLCVSIARAVLAVLAPICLITSAVAGVYSYNEFEGKDEKHWKSDDGGYKLHVTAAFCEWALVLLMVAFFLTYISELDNHVTEVNVRYTQNNVTVEED